MGLYSQADHPPNEAHSEATSPPVWLKLRAKGWLALFGLFAYLAFMSASIINQKYRMAEELEQLGRVYKLEENLQQFATSVLQTSREVNRILALPEPVQAEALERQHRFIANGYLGLSESFPALKANWNLVDASFNSLRTAPSATGLVELNQHLNKALTDVVMMHGQFESVAETLSNALLEKSNSAAAASLLIGLLGVCLISALALLFFSRLTRDLQMLKKRAIGIIQGARGAPIPVARRDEVGELTQAINSLAAALDQREKDLEIERQKSSHREKMAALGSLAAGLLHEIGNPVAAIHGIAYAMKEAQASGNAAPGDGICEPDLILRETNRLASITRQISEFAAPPPSERQLQDMNALVDRTIGLMRYDQHLRSVNLQLNLDRQLPAVPGMADRLTQLIMSLVGNAVETAASYGVAKPSVSVWTRKVSGGVLLGVGGDGPAVDDEATAHGLGQPFLGLPICQSIVAEHGGTITSQAALGGGIMIGVFLPTSEPEYSARTHDLSANSHN